MRQGMGVDPNAAVVSNIVENDPVHEADKDGFYHDILDGLSVYLDNDFILDILHTLREYPVLRLGESLNLSQVTCKKWLLDQLPATLGTEFGTIYVLGGWYGVLGAMLLHDPRFSVDKIVSIDIDPDCRPVSEALNRCHALSGVFESVTADVYDLDYAAMLSQSGVKDRQDLLINTSCEHLIDTKRWLEAIPAGTPMVTQSNDYFDCDEHVNCVPDLEVFRQQMQLSNVLFEGQLKLKKYNRFMLIGSR